MLADLRDATRQLRKAPGFTATALITLALGIGATTAIFTLVHQVMLKSLPVTNPGELWKIGDKDRCCNWGGFTQGNDNDFALFSWEAYRNFREHTPEFLDLAALQAGNASLGVRRAGSQGPLETRNGEYVSGNFFRTFGIQPWLGRLFTDDDNREGAPPVAVMTYRIWQEKYGADASVVGAAFQINGNSFTIIGVAPPGFFGAKLDSGGMPDFWLPITTELLSNPNSGHLTRPQGNYLDLIGRVRPGVDPKSLEAKLRVELHNWLQSHVPDMEPSEKELWQKQTLHLVPGGAGVTALRDEYESGLKLLLIAAGCVLLVACGNLANLMLARGLKDRAQTSIRIALGASRKRIIRRSLVECVTLSAIGGALGIAVAYAGTKLILHLAFQNGRPGDYVPISATPSLPVLFFTLGISVLTGILFGIAPAWVTSHSDPVEALRGVNRSLGGGRAWTQRSLVIAQAAVSIVLLSAAALLAQSLRNLQHQDFGFEPQGRYLAEINPQLSNYKPEQLEPLYRKISDGLRAIPGVRMVTASLYAPMSGDSWNEGIRVEGRPEPPATEDTSAGWARVTPGFFETLGATIMLGRPITEQDTAATQNVAVINEAFAKKFFKGQNPIGQHFGMDRVSNSATYEIVGVARDIRYMTWGIRKPVDSMFWISEAQTVKYDDRDLKQMESSSHFLGNLVIWAPGNPPGMEERLRKALLSIDPNLVVYTVDPYSKVLSNDFQQEQMIATLTSLFGALGLILAAIGLYGVLAYMVEQRTSEIGLRMALGADRVQVTKLVLRGAFLQIGIGLAIGIPAAIAAGKLMSNQLFGVQPWDPIMLALAALMLGLAALFASAIPARRAAGVEPMIALRNG